MKTKHILPLAVLAGLLLGGSLHAQIFVTSYNGFAGDGSIGEYNLDGSTVNASLVSDLYLPQTIAVSGTDLFVFNSVTSGYISEYTTAGTSVNPSLIYANKYSQIAASGTDLFVVISGTNVGEFTTAGNLVNNNSLYFPSMDQPYGIAVSGPDIFIANQGNNTIGEYTTAGDTVNASLITGLTGLGPIAISGSDVFALYGTSTSGTIGEFTTAGGIVNASLITGLTNDATDIAVSGTDIYVANNGFAIDGAGSIGEYTITGGTVNASLISGLYESSHLAVVSEEVIPEPSSWALLAMGGAGLLAFRQRRGRES